LLGIGKGDFLEPGKTIMVFTRVILSKLLRIGARVQSKEGEKNEGENASG